MVLKDRYLLVRNTTVYSSSILYCQAQLWESPESAGKLSPFKEMAWNIPQRNSMEEAVWNMVGADRRESDLVIWEYGPENQRS